MAHHEKDIVVINGRRYAAGSGKPLDGVSRSVDGVSHKPHQHIADTMREHTKIAASRHPAHAHALHKRPQPARPHTPAHKQIDTNRPAHANNHRAAHIDAIRPDLLQSQRLTQDRAKRAQQIERSRQISKFGVRAAPAPSVPMPYGEPLQTDLQPLPPHIPPRLKVPEALPESIPEPEGPVAVPAEQPAKTKPHRLRRAARTLRKPKAISMAATALSVLLVSGYILYLNVPNLALRIAASRSGVKAVAPGFKPQGFRFSGPIEYSEGTVVLGYSSTTDERSYHIRQRTSNWDSQSLLENYVRRESGQYVTFQEKGLTIYVYNGSNATWVNGGVWYVIEGNTLLSTDQLLKIATSL